MIDLSEAVARALRWPVRRAPGRLGRDLSRTCARVGRRRRGLAGVVIALVVVTVTACDPPPIPNPGYTAGSLGGSPSQVALTFDDGPSPNWTPMVLDILDRYGVKATFFVVGSVASRYPDLVRDIVARGHSIANHTWSHATLTGLPDGRLHDELDGTSRVIHDLTVGVTGYPNGYVVSCARPPYGSTNARVNNTIASLNMRPALWSIDTNDWRHHDPLSSTRFARPDAVILMHDGGGNRSLTVSRLSAVLEDLRARGIGTTRVCDSRR